MSSLRSHPPARTPSRTSHAFRTNQNDHFSPFGSLAELNAATTQLVSAIAARRPVGRNAISYQCGNPTRQAPPPPHGSMYAGSDHGRGTPQRAHRNNLPPPEEDDMGSFYGEEIDYGKVTSQLVCPYLVLTVSDCLPCCPAPKRPILPSRVERGPPGLTAWR